MRKRSPLEIVFCLVLTLALNLPVRAQPVARIAPSPFPVLSTFNLRFTLSDLSIPSHDLPLEFSRTYDSSYGPEVSSALGRGWAHSYGMGLEFEAGQAREWAILTDSEGRRWAFERRLDGSYVTPPGIRAELTEDLERRRYQLTFQDGRTYLFNAQGRLERIWSAWGNERRLIYGEAGRLRRVEAASGAWLELGYDEAGRLTQVEDSTGRVVRYEQDEAGRLLRVVGPLGEETAYGYGEDGRLISVKDALGREVKAGYDGMGNLASVTDPLGGRTEYDFIPSGFFETAEGERIYFPNKLTVQDPLGRQTEAAFNDLGDPLKVKGPAGHETFYTWDGRGNLTGVTDPLGNRTKLVWDEYSNLIGLEDPLRNRWELRYDEQDRLMEVSDPAGNAVKLGYGQKRLPTEIRNAEGGVVELSYTPAGEVESYRDPNGNATRFTYGPLGRPLTKTDALGRRWSYSYNARGDLTRVEKPGGEAKEIVRHREGRIEQVLYPDGSRVVYTRDAGGRLIRAEGPQSSVAIEYNAMDLPIRVTATSSADGSSTVVSYEYDALGRRVKMTDAEGRQTRYAYDPAGNLSVLTPPAGGEIRFEYDAAGRRTGVVYPNGVKVSTRYDAAGNVLEIRAESAPVIAGPGAGGAKRSPLARVRYGYDALNNCVWKIDAEGETTYAYDKLSRLTEVVYPDGETIRYTYDAAGNRLTEGSTYNALNQLVTRGETHYEYDASGNLISKGEGEKVTRYRYDFEGRLMEVIASAEGAKQSPSGSATYAYDPLGRRISKTTSAGTIRYAYDQEDIIRELGPAGAVRRYLHGPGIDDLLGVVQLGSDPAGGQTPVDFDVSYFLSDRLGSITAALDHAGKVRETITYGPFGSVIARSGATKQSPSVRGEPVEPRSNLDFLFTGRQFDPESGLYYYRNRYYAPEQGRFTTPDPLGLAAGPNLYTYVSNNPVNLTDPWGLGGGAATAAAAAVSAAVSNALGGGPFANAVAAGVGGGLAAAGRGWVIGGWAGVPLGFAAGFSAGFLGYLAGDLGYKFFRGKGPSEEGGEGAPEPATFFLLLVGLLCLLLERRFRLRLTLAAAGYGGAKGRRPPCRLGE